MGMDNKVMSTNSRTKNVKLNVLYGYIAQIGIFILSFVGRRIFLNFLSASYLGINGLYSNILTILSLAELGLDTAVVYSLYKPVAEQDTKLIHSLIVFFKKIYYILAIGIFILGMALTPFLKYLVTSDLPTQDLIAYYILFLINTVASYFVAHKVALLSASQQQRVQKLVTLSANLILQVVHIVVLFIWKNFYIYIIATVCTTILSNIVLGWIADKLHPAISKETEIVEFDKRPIFNRIGAAFLYKIGAVLVNSTDNILISVLVSTIAVGYYSNYYTVTAAVTGFISIITTSLVAGIGNLAAKGSKKEQRDLFDMMLLFYHWMAAFGLIGFSLLFNNLITLWLGEEYLFDLKTVFIIAFYFYLTNAISPVWMFREANGIFSKVKFIILIRAAINIVLSFWLGSMWGVFGIFVATAISLLLTNFWYEPRILSNDILGRPEREYWIKQAKYAIITLISYALCFYAIKPIGDSILMLVLKAIIIVAITSFFFIVFNAKTDEMKKMVTYIRR